MTNNNELSKYATQTAADMGADYAAAVRAMSDEPGEVAADLQITVAEVAEWCAAGGPLATVEDAIAVAGDDLVIGGKGGGPIVMPLPTTPMALPLATWVAFETACLSIGDEFLPAAARKARDRVTMTGAELAEYETWLESQWEDD